MHEGPDDAPDDDDAGFSVPLPPDDRLWRHPSEIEPIGTMLPPRRRRRVTTDGWLVAVGAALAGSLLTVALLALLGALGGDRPVTVVRETVRPRAAPASATREARPGVVRIAAEARPAIARIDVEGTEPGTGSAVLFRDDGHLMTNAHVVEGARRITVVLSDGTEHDGEVVGADELTDIAVVRVDDERPFPTAVLGTAVDLQVGQPAVAIGSPLGLVGGSSVTTGVVSALGRRVESEEGPTLLDMIQTDAAISFGSSGGALLDASGAVIGITTAIAVSDVGAEGLGFATPIDIARSVAVEIIETGHAVHVWLGIEGSDLDSASARRAGVAGGALVERVVEGSPASEAGLVDGDIILAVSGEEVASMSALVIALRDREPGESVVLDVLRGDERSSVSVVLAERE